MYHGKVKGNIPRQPGVFHVRIRLHNTWLLAFVLVTFIVSTSVQQTIAVWNRIIAGTEIVFVFISILFLRQFVLNLIAISRGIPLRRVTLYIIGGVPGIPRQFTSPKTEFTLALAGFAVSVIGILVFYIAYILMVINDVNWFGDLTLQLIFLMTLFLLFHFLPAYPLDGGRILRAFLWRKTQNYDLSTRIASIAGIVIGAFVIMTGIILPLTQQPWFVSAVVIVIGSTICIAAGETLTTMRLRSHLLETKVSEVSLNAEISLVDSKMNIINLVRKYIQTRGEYFFLAVDREGKPTSFFTLRDIMKISRKSWNYRTVDSLGIRSDRVYQVKAEQSTADVLEQMMVMDIEGLPVMKDDAVIGVIERKTLFILTRMRKDMEIFSETVPKTSTVAELLLRSRNAFDR
jgi:Zn-dependent protease